MSRSEGVEIGSRLNLNDWLETIRRTRPVRHCGRVVEVVGLRAESAGPSARIGELCHIQRRGGEGLIRAEVMGFRDDRVLLLPLGPTSGIEPGSLVIAQGRSLRVPVGPSLLGRVVTAFGEPLDDGPPIRCSERRSLQAPAPAPLKRRPLNEPLPLGVRALDGLLTCAKGQRLGIFSGSGVGKSALLGMIARHSRADVNVIGLVGERGREVGEFVMKHLGSGLENSVVVAATSDEPALVRLKAAFTATTIAEYFRDQGHDVLLIMDSITRVATAQRDAGLAGGEPPTTRGYPPSVYSLLPKLVERAGSNERGTITGLYAVLVEEDDMTDPVADAMRAVLDGHIVLSRRLAAEGHFPAIDVTASVSRAMHDVVSPQHLSMASRCRKLLAAYAEVKDLLDVGAYEPGADAAADEAVRLRPFLQSFLRQSTDEATDLDDAVRQLRNTLAGEERAAT